MQPVDRRSVTANSSLNVLVEGHEMPAKVQAVLPLPESLRVLRELAAPFGAGMLVVANSKGDLEPGLRVQSPNLPTYPIATVPKRAVKPESPRGGENMMVQVIRDEYVTNIPVRVLGESGTERLQIAGALRMSDALIASTSVPLLPGTLVRFGDNGSASAGEGGPASPTSSRQSPAPRAAAAARLPRVHVQTRAPAGDRRLATPARARSSSGNGTMQGMSQTFASINARGRFRPITASGPRMSQKLRAAVTS